MDGCDSISVFNVNLIFLSHPEFGGDIVPIEIYPNPAHDYFYIQGLPNELITITLLDFSGKQVKSLHVDGDFQISTASLSRGTYIVEVKGQVMPA